MAFNTTFYYFPIISKMRDILNVAYSGYAYESVELSERVVSGQPETFGDITVEFKISKWKYSFKDTWNGVPFNEPIIDMALTRRRNYTATIVKQITTESDNTQTITYTVTATINK